MLMGATWQGHLVAEETVHTAVDVVSRWGAGNSRTSDVGGCNHTDTVRDLGHEQRF